MIITGSYAKQPPKPPANLAGIIARVQLADAEHYRRELLAAGFTEEYARDEAVAVAGSHDRTSTVGHAMLSGLLENA